MAASCWRSQPAIARQFITHKPAQAMATKMNGALSCPFSVTKKRENLLLWSGTRFSFIASSSQPVNQ